MLESGRFSQGQTAAPTVNDVGGPGMGASMLLGPKVAAIDLGRVARPDVYTFRLGRNVPVDQQRAGVCWAMAGLNHVRLALASQMGLPDMNLSIAYIMWHDKFERSRFFLHRLRDIATASTPSKCSHVRDFWCAQPLGGDGGHFNFFQNLVEKYGVVPEEVMPSTSSSGHTADMNFLLHRVLREAGARILKDPTGFDNTLKDALAFVETILNSTLGTPPGPDTEFGIEWTSVGGGGGGGADAHFPSSQWENMTARSLFKRAGLDFKEWVVLCHDPRHPMGSWLRMPQMNNMVQSDDASASASPRVNASQFLNVSIEHMRASAFQTIFVKRQPVWLGCDVSKQSSIRYGIMDAMLFRWEWLLGKPLPAIDRKTSLEMRDGCATHAMLMTGLHFNSTGRSALNKKAHVDSAVVETESSSTVTHEHVDGWLVENSWHGREHNHGRNGYLLMDPSWWDENVWQVVVHRSCAQDAGVRIPEERGDIMVDVEEGDPMFQVYA